MGTVVGRDEIATGRGETTGNGLWVNGGQQMQVGRERGCDAAGWQRGYGQRWWSRDAVVKTHRNGGNGERYGRARSGRAPLGAAFRWAVEKTSLRTLHDRSDKIFRRRNGRLAVETRTRGFAFARQRSPGARLSYAMWPPWIQTKSSAHLRLECLHRRQTAEERSVYRLSQAGRA